MVNAQLEQGYEGQNSHIAELKQSLAETQRQMTQMGGLLELSQVDSQRLDQGLTDLKENVFLNSVAVERLREDCQREIEKVRTLSGQQISVEAYQEHARSNEQALEQCRSQMTAQERKIDESEQQLRRLQREVGELSNQNTPRAENSVVPNRDPELAIRLSQLEEGLRNQKRALEQLQEDSVEDARSIKRYLDQVHDLVSSSLQREQTSGSAFPERARPESTRLTQAARKGDSRVEVEDSSFCRIGEIVLIGGQEARTVLGKSNLIFKTPLEGEYPEGTTVRHLRENEYLQLDGEDVYVYARNAEGESHLVCCVDLIHRESPERAEERDDLRDQVYSDDLRRKWPDGAAMDSISCV